MATKNAGPNKKLSVLENNRAISLRVGVALFCSLSSFLVTNGSIYPTIALIDPFIRDIATAFGVAILGLLVVIMERAPHCIHPRLFTGVALGAVVGYFISDCLGLQIASTQLLLLGSLLDSLAEAWLFVLVYVSFSLIDSQRRPAVAMGACLSAYLLQPFVNNLDPFSAVGINALGFVVLYLCIRPLIAIPLEEARLSEPQAEMAVANPRSFLPVNHLLFITVFIFSIAQGLAITLPGPFNDAPTLPAAFIPLAIILLVYVIRGRMPNADGLFSLCALLIIGGMFLQQSDQVVSSGAASVSNTLIDAGASCFSLLLVLLVGSIAGRNQATALPISALMLGLYWFGVLLGAILGNSAMTLLGWTKVALIWTSFCSTMVFVVFCFIVLKNVSFVEAIEAIQPPIVVCKTIDTSKNLTTLNTNNKIHKTQQQLAIAQNYGLTPRETEVLELLAQGRTVGVIREKLVISLNTARFHTKNIYAKLGVHSQQELIDLVEQYELDS